MSDAGARAFERTTRRVEELIAALENLPDGTARASARELAEMVLNLHAAGLDRLLELVVEADGGQTLLERLAADAQVSGLLLLHGLHPAGLDTRVRTAVERLRPHLGVAGARIEALEIADQGVHVRVRPGARAGRAAMQKLKAEIEDAIIEAAPDADDVHVDGLDMAVAYVPITSIKRREQGQRGDVADR